MYAFVSVLLIGAGLYFRGDCMPWCFIASGLFAIASAIDSLNFKFEMEDEDDKK